MKKLFLKDVIEAVQGKILQGQSSLIIEDVTTRFKNLRQGTLVLDLHRKNDFFASQPPPSSSFAIITDEPSKYIETFSNAAIVKVKDIRTAYRRFVEYYRGLFDIPVIGVTGTCGKTTTKEMISHILSQKMKVKSTYKSYNAQVHHLGYLLDFDDTTEAAVIEMGVAFPGDLKSTCRYFKPQIGVITNIGVDHLNAFGAPEEYIKAKAEFIEGLDYKGTLIINADDENIKKIDFSEYQGRLVKYGFDRASQFQIVSLKQHDDGLDFTLKNNGQSFRFFVPGYGEFIVKNAAAAIASACAVGFDIKEAGEALKSFHNVERHFEVKRGINRGLIIDDTWSTNPTSAVEALKVLKSLSDGKKAIAALGKMSLLGKRSDYYHQKVGEEAAKIGVDELIVIGEEAFDIGKGALIAGMPPEHVHFCTGTEQVFKILKEAINKDSITLIKTSMLASYKDLIGKVTIDE